MAKHSILVTGDYLIDHHIYEGRRQRSDDRVGDGVRVIEQAGGAALEHDLLQALHARETAALKKKRKRALRKPDWDVHQGVTTRPSSARTPLSANHAYALWSPDPESETWKEQTWRVKAPMGFGPAASAAPGRLWPVKRNLPAAPSVLAISDGGMGFRDTEKLWPKSQIDRADAIVVNTTAPMSAAAVPTKAQTLWHYLVEHAVTKLVVIVSVRDLRQSAALISHGLSWDESVQGVLRALATRGPLEHLTRCRHLIVTFDYEGALWLDFSQPPLGIQKDTRAQLVYHASSIEGERGVATQGENLGFLSCMTAAIARELTRPAPQPASSSGSPLTVDLSAALDAGLCAARDLREQGHGFAWEIPTGFPADRLAKALAEPPWVYSRAPFIADSALANGWSLVQRANSHTPLGKAAYDLGRFVLERGPIALANVPHVKVGKYITADRYEVESLRVLLQVVRRYQSATDTERPLSIGIFGAPGAGKSFAVKELAKSLGEDAQWMEFNLSQFGSAADLIGAFHQIRDQVLQQKLPVAFFDEFDSQNYLWLKYLLAPMQDGRFQDGALTHTLGKSILVMAGGTSGTFARLGPHGSADAERAWQLAKGPDFKSRLDAYMDVVGSNARDTRDELFPVRRALMIRSSLECDENETLTIDPGLIEALLHVDTYVNGSRSLTKVVQSLAADRGEIRRRSSLMPETQLAMHTDAKEFAKLCKGGAASEPSPRNPLTARQIKRVAPAINATYKRRFGGKSWAKLSKFLKDSNRAAAGRMIHLLAMVHLRLNDGAETNTDDERAVRDHIEYYLEALAKAEHDLWAEWHVAQGWRWTSETKKDEKRKLHPDLRPYAELKTGESNKDRRQIRAFPDFAKAAGMKIVFAREATDAVSRPPHP